MKTTSLALALCVLGFSVPARIQDSDSIEKLSADLDGDGKKDAISAFWIHVEGKFHLRVNQVKTQDDNGGTEVGTLSTIDLDRSDRFKEVVVTTGFLKDNYIYRYDGKTLTLLGVVRNMVSVPGDGTLLEDDDHEFWVRHDRHVFNAKTGKLERVPQELYAVNTPATVAQSFVLTYGARDKVPVATLATGSKVEVLAALLVDGHHPMPRYRDYRYLVRSASGLLGWVPSKGLDAKLSFPPPSKRTKP
ncbi:hypothetical protein [Corallococcus sp. M7]